MRNDRTTPLLVTFLIGAAGAATLIHPPATTEISPNLINNPSVEAVDPYGVPDDWTTGQWGSLTASFDYSAVAEDGQHGLHVSVHDYASGDAKWFFAPVSASPGARYTFSDHYRSSIATETVVQYVDANEVETYEDLGTNPASADWRESDYSFTPPPSAVELTVFHRLAGNGDLWTDDFSLTEDGAAAVPTVTQGPSDVPPDSAARDCRSSQPSPHAALLMNQTSTDDAAAGFSQGLVSITFDDAWRSVYTNGLPLLEKYGLPSTQYLLTGKTSNPLYMTAAMMRAFEAQGSEIASHTVTHPHLTQISRSQLSDELTQSQSYLRANVCATAAKNFAAPYGDYDPTVMNDIETYYRSQRSTDVGYNAKDSFDIYDIKVQNVDQTTTPETVQEWVSKAIQDRTWLVIVYHEVSRYPADENFSVTPEDLDAELRVVKDSGVEVKTVDQALDEIVPQLPS